MTKWTAREMALEVIYQVNEEMAYANLALDQMMAKQPDMDGRDKALTTEMVYGSVKYRGRLDWVLNHYAKPKVSKMDPWVRNILRLGLYQLMFLDKIPPSAAVNEAVNLAKKYAKRGADKFVNGVLRSAQRGLDQLAYPPRGKQPVGYLSVTYSFPEWLISRWYKTYGLKKTEALCQYFNAPSPLWVRCNTLKITPDALKAQFEAQGIAVTASGDIAEGLRIDSAVNLHNLDLFQQGYFTVQDESSMHVGLAAAPQNGQRVLDVCSAPGGKATHMAQLMQNSGHIVACDIHPHRLELIAENARRLGITNIETRLQDGEHLAEAFPEPFDVVVVDAPCSGLGILGRRADARWSKQPTDLEELCRLQQSILEQAAQVTKLGGALLYSTCTMTEEENERQVERFLMEHAEFALDEQLSQCWLRKRPPAGMVQFLPFQDGMDGFFIAKFRRKG